MSSDNFQKMNLKTVDRRRSEGYTAYISKIEPMTDSEIQSTREFLGM